MPTPTDLAGGGEPFLAECQSQRCQHTVVDRIVPDEQRRPEASGKARSPDRGADLGPLGLNRDTS